MFVVTLSKTSLKKLGLGAMCCALVVGSALLGRFISNRTVAVSAAVNKIGRRIHHGRQGQDPPQVG